MSLSAKPCCAVCQTSRDSATTLSRCAACKSIFYCSREHQIQDRDAHKSQCNAIKRSQAALDREETRLRNHPGDLMTPSNLFGEEHAGHFWGILETRTYMRNRYAVVEALLKIKTYAAVDAAHTHLMDMLRLCRGDNMGLRSVVPAVKLRLGRDQEAYDFVKWWITTGKESDYDWGNLDLPFLDVRNADVCEDIPSHLLSRYVDLSHAVAVILIKVRLLLDLRTSRDAAILGGKSSPDLLDADRALPLNVSSSATLLEKQNPENVESASNLIDRLLSQVQELYGHVSRRNRFFWPAVREPGGHLTARPDSYSEGSVQEMQLALQYCWDAWIESPGAIRLLDQECQ